MGDSILGQFQDETSVAAILEDITGKTVFNAALGGTCMGRINREGLAGHTKDVLDMEALATAIAIGDFGAQQTARIRENGTEHFAGVIDGLETVDFDRVQVLFICHGINDYHSGTPIFNPEDSLDPYTYAGALRKSLKLLQQAYPNLQIVLVTPTFSWYPGSGYTGEEHDYGGGTLKEYVEAEISVAEELGVEVIDVYHDFYLHDQMDDWMTYTTDGVHPNEGSRSRLAQRLADWLDKH